MSGGISSNYNSGGNIYTTGWRGAGSAGSAGSADSMSSAGSAGSFGSTVTGSANGSFGNMLNDITFDLAYDNISFHGVGQFILADVGVIDPTPDGPYTIPFYEPDGSSDQGNVDAPYTDKGWLGRDE